MNDALKRKVDILDEDLLKCKTEMGKELEKGNLRMNGLSLQVNEVKESIDEVKEALDLLLKIFRASKGFYIFSGWVGSIIIKLGLVLGSIAGLVYFIKTGSWK